MMKMSSMSKPKISTKCDKKIFRCTGYVQDDLTDRLHCISAAIEDSYLQMHVEDYTAEDCISKAFELLKIEFGEQEPKSTKGFEWATGMCGCEYCYSLRKKL